MKDYFVETCYRSSFDPLNPNIRVKSGPLHLPSGVLFYHTTSIQIGENKTWTIIDDADNQRMRDTEIKIINSHGGQSGFLTTNNETVYNSTVRELDDKGCPRNTE